MMWMLTQGHVHRGVKKRKKVHIYLGSSRAMKALEPFSLMWMVTQRRLHRGRRKVGRKKKERKRLHIFLGSWIFQALEPFSLMWMVTQRHLHSGRRKVGGGGGGGGGKRERENDYTFFLDLGYSRRWGRFPWCGCWHRDTYTEEEKTRKTKQKR